MSENTPSQAEGEPEPGAPEAEQPPRTTPSQAEGADPGDENANESTDESDDA
ncbi:hypothetical protein ACFY71_15530 [Streptomyces cinerochromogenes]|uniref:hypothetical protein n=1 Tax=Streptomyces cinerochromogenes TaxID=66422 RepID=UPI0036C41972